MRCPIRQMQFINKDEGAIHDTLECIGKECAGWDEDKGQCGAITLLHNIGMLALALTKIERTLAKMEKRMPWEGQFRER